MVNDTSGGVTTKKKQLGTKVNTKERVEDQARIQGGK